MSGRGAVGNKKPFVWHSMGPGGCQTLAGSDNADMP